MRRSRVKPTFCKNGVSSHPFTPQAVPFQSHPAAACKVIVCQFRIRVPVREFRRCGASRTQV
jgi:hypothetical protein